MNLKAYYNLQSTQAIFFIKHISSLGREEASSSFNRLFSFQLFMSVYLCWCSKVSISSTFIMKIMRIFLSLLGTLLIAKNLGLCSLKSGFLTQNMSLEWFINSHLSLELSSFILLYLIILFGLLVQVLLLISEMINGVLLLL